MRKRRSYPTQRTKRLFIPSMRSIYDRDYELAMEEFGERSALWLKKSFNSYKEDVRLRPSLGTKARFAALVDSLILIEKKESSLSTVGLVGGGGGV